MFKDKLKFLRNEKGISQRELAKILDVSNSTIAMYETGKRQPDNQTLSQIADYFNVSVDYLLGRIEKEWWEKDEEPTDIELEDFIKNQSNIKLMGDPLDEAAKDDVMMFLRAAHQLIKEKRQANNGK